MEITLDIPEPVARTLGYARETLPRRALEALLVEECVLGRLSRGKVAEILARQRERSQFAGQEIVPCARVCGNGFASLMTP